MWREVEGLLVRAEDCLTRMTSALRALWYSWAWTCSWTLLAAGFQLPKSLKRKVGVRGRQKSPTKERITIRLSRAVVQSSRATGDGWQTRVDTALKDWLKANGRGKLKAL